MTTSTHQGRAFLSQENTISSLAFEKAAEWNESDGDLWVHLNRACHDCREWIANNSELTPHTIRALLDNGTRPRIEIAEDGLLLVLRGVNLNEGADPSDMVSLRIWVEPHRLVSIEREKLKSIEAILQQASRNEGPYSTGALLVEIIKGLTTKAGPTIDGMNEHLDMLEDLIIGPTEQVDRTELLVMRQQVVKLHRYLKPQSEVLSTLQTLKTEFLNPGLRRELSMVANTVTRYVEDLESLRNRLTLIQDELSNQYAEQLNNRMYAATMIATILLPMTIITGLLGINVGGIPGSSSRFGFLIVCVILLASGALGYWIIRRWRWL